MDDRYGSDVLAAGWRDKGRPTVATVPAERGLVVEVALDDFVGAVTGVTAGHVELVHGLAPDPGRPADAPGRLGAQRHHVG